jgi:hypothetical protein
MHNDNGSRYHIAAQDSPQDFLSLLPAAPTARTCSRGQEAAVPRTRSSPGSGRGSTTTATPTAVRVGRPAATTPSSSGPTPQELAALALPVTVAAPPLLATTTLQAMSPASARMWAVGKQNSTHLAMVSIMQRWVCFCSYWVYIFALSDYYSIPTDNGNSSSIPKANGNSSTGNNSSQSRNKSNAPILAITLPVVTVLGLVVSAILVCIWRRSRLKRKQSCKFQTSITVSYLIVIVKHLLVETCMSAGCAILLKTTSLLKSGPFVSAFHLLWAC